MIMRIILAAMIALSLLLLTTTLAHTYKDLLKLMPKDLSKQMIVDAKNEIVNRRIIQNIEENLHGWPQLP